MYLNLHVRVYTYMYIRGVVICACIQKIMTVAHMLFTAPPTANPGYATDDTLETNVTISMHSEMAHWLA